MITHEEISACVSKEQLTLLLNQVNNRKDLCKIFRAYGLNYAGLNFCAKETLAEYLACELWILKQKKHLRQKVSLIDRLAGVLERKFDDTALSFSGATLAGMMMFMLVL